MWRALQKMVAVLVAVGLTVSGPISSHARMGISGHATAHEIHAVPHYADLAIDPGEDECPHALPGTTHDDGLCNKCCAACLGASVIPTVPVAVWGPSVARNILSTHDVILIARSVPTEPGIPKPF
jgi:hypothetical protein